MDDDDIEYAGQKRHAATENGTACGTAEMPLLTTYMDCRVTCAACLSIIG